MGEIQSLYDAIVKTQVKEDQCTNFLLWLLKTLPSSVLLTICGRAGLSVSVIESPICFQVQYILSDSRPDGLISLSDTTYLIVETKRFPNCYDHDQFSNHLKGGCAEFGEENTWCLFISGDEKIPNKLASMKMKHLGRIGFISWKTILELLRSAREILNDKDCFLVDEFLHFTKHYQLGRVQSMTNDEIKDFLSVYPITIRYEEAIFEKFYQFLTKLKDLIILDSDEQVEEDSEEGEDDNPCLYISLSIDGWHLARSSFLYLDLLTRKVGVMLIGYQDDKEKKKFIPLWHEKYKDKYKVDLGLCSLTWVNPDEDEYSTKAGYFKVVKGSTGKSFSPDKISEFNKYFYWGYVHDLDVDDLETLLEIVPKDFKKLLDTFVEL